MEAAGALGERIGVGGEIFVSQTGAVVVETHDRWACGRSEGQVSILEDSYSFRGGKYGA